MSAVDLTQSVRMVAAELTDIQSTLDIELDQTLVDYLAEILNYCRSSIDDDQEFLVWIKEVGSRLNMLSVRCRALKRPDLAYRIERTLYLALITKSTLN